MHPVWARGSSDHPHTISQFYLGVLTSDGMMILMNRLGLLYKMKFLTQIEVNFIDEAQNITMDVNYVCAYLYMHVYIAVDMKYVCMYLYISIYSYVDTHFYVSEISTT